MTRQDHTRWKLWPFSGAYAPSGGHVKALGFQYGWVNQWDAAAKWSPTWSFSVFGLFYITHEPWRGTRWALGKISLKFERAQWRIGKREEARERREARKRFASAAHR